MLQNENWKELSSLDALESWQYLNDKIKIAIADSIPLKSQNKGIKKRKFLWMNETTLKKTQKEA